MRIHHLNCVSSCPLGGLVRPTCTPGLRFYQWMMEKDRGLRLLNQRRLRELRASNAQVQIHCSHDPVEFERIAGRRMGELPERAPERAPRLSTREERRSYQP
jgi:hypothetical protein